MDVHLYVYGADGKEQGMFATGQPEYERPLVASSSRIMNLVACTLPDRMH